MRKPRATNSFSCGIRRALVLALVAAAAILVAAPGASAARPCWNAVLNDWFVDGRIDKTYPIACYTQATQHLGEDAKNYSGAPDDIRRALLAAIRLDRPNGPGGSDGGSNSSSGGGGGGGSGSPSTGSSGGGTTTTAPSSDDNKGPVGRAIGWLGPSNAESIPLPLLILGAAALLLLALAAASWFYRRTQSRRLEPRPGPDQL